MAEPDAPLFVAMCGIPFAGKTRLAMQLAIEMDCSLVSVDGIVTSLGIELGPDARNNRGWARAMATGFDWSRKLLANGDPVVFDNANHTRRNRDRCRRVAEQTGGRFRLVWVDTPVETARQRLEDNRARMRTRRDVPDASFREIVEQFEPPLDEPDVIRVTRGMAIDEMIRAVIPKDIDRAVRRRHHSARASRTSGGNADGSRPLRRTSVASQENTWQPT